MSWNPDIVSVLLATAVPIILIGGIVNRCIVTHESKSGKLMRGRGIGWQFIRFTAISTGLPVAGILALNGAMSSEVATLFAAVIGFAFGKSGGD